MKKITAYIFIGVILFSAIPFVAHAETRAEAEARAYAAYRRAGVASQEAHEKFTTAKNAYLACVESYAGLNPLCDSQDAAYRSAQSNLNQAQTSEQTALRTLRQIRALSEDQAE